MTKRKPTAQKLSMTVKDSQIKVTKIDGKDYICLTDMTKSAGSNRALFKLHDFVCFKNNAGVNSFNPSISEWIEKVRFQI